MVREVVKDSFQDTANRTYVSTTDVFTSILIVNRHTASLTLSIHDYVVTVDADEVLDEAFTLFSTFSIAATGAYEVQLRGLIDNE